ncbi:hypothetical protein PVL29_024461 [Vitis rotundifolia]|uniref:Uncharacterized protein n=1 Tax=Vitis rotundifolia TaxID=103349 RepID=A0AA38YS95_VITRO|nr:hypothetical protein PVL29_024461 [Vitis rotundifolia]
MATQTGVLIRDQNMKFHFDGIGERKALGDLTNSGKPSPIKASKRHCSMIFTSVGEEVDAFRSKQIRSRNSISRAQEKAQTSERKRNPFPMFQIIKMVKPLTWGHGSNSGLPKIWVVTTSVMEEHFLPNSIAEEQFLHNHEECIKAQNMNMSKDYFLETIGLHNDFSMQLPSCHVPPPASSRKPKLELEEIAKLMIEDQSPLCLKIELPCEYKSSSCSPKTPKSSNPNTGSNYFVGLLQIEPNVTMIETLVLPKHLLVYSSFH